MENNLKIREIREARGMTQRAVANGLRIAPSSVAKWELGYTNISMDNLLALAVLFNCTTDALLGREPLRTGQAS